MTFTYDYAPRFCSNMGHLVNIYKIKNDSLYSVVVTQEPEKTSYNYGEAIDLTGLEIDIHSQSGTEHVTYDYSLDNNFSYPSVATGEGEVLLEVYYMNKKFTIPITVNKSTWLATKIGELADYRGSYMLVEEGIGYGFNGATESTKISKNFEMIQFDYQGICYAKNEGQYDRLRCVVSKDENGYHILCDNNNYIDLDGICFSSDSTTSLVIEHTSYGVMIRRTNGGYLCFDSLGTNRNYAIATMEEIEGADFLTPIVLYKYELTSEEQSKKDTFTSTFISTTNVCKEDGSSFSITSNDWGDLKEAFASLSGTVQAEFVNTLYNIIGEEDTSAIQFAMSRYDYIYNKYHDHPSYSYITDFIGRLEAGTMQSSGRGTFFRIDTQAMNSTIIVIVVVSTALVAASLLLVYRKKKNQK